MSENKSYLTNKQWIFLIIIISIIFVNWYFNNIIINTFYFISSIPRLIAIAIAVLFIMFPRFMNNTEFLDLIPTKKHSL